MHTRTWETAAVLVTGSAAVLWIVGIVLFLVPGSREVQHLGLLLVLIAANVTVLGVLRSWQLRMHRAFVHGYHAGRHDRAGTYCDSRTTNCDVLEMAEVRARRMSKLG